MKLETLLLVWVALSFAAYNLFSAINRSLTTGRLAGWLFGRAE